MKIESSKLLLEKSGGCPNDPESGSGSQIESIMDHLVWDVECACFFVTNIVTDHQTDMQGRIEFDPIRESKNSSLLLFFQIAKDWVVNIYYSIDITSLGAWSADSCHLNGKEKKLEETPTEL